MLSLRVSKSVLHFKVSFLPVTVMWNWCQRNILFGKVFNKLLTLTLLKFVFK